MQREIKLCVFCGRDTSSKCQICNQCLGPKRVLSHKNRIEKDPESLTDLDKPRDFEIDLETKSALIEMTGN